MMGSRVLTPDGPGVVTGYVETGVEVMLDNEYIADEHGIFHQLVDVYKPEDLAVIE